MTLTLTLALTLTLTLTLTLALTLNLALTLSLSLSPNPSPKPKQAAGPPPGTSGMMRPPGTASMRGGGIAPRAGQPQPQLMSRMGTGQAGEASENRPMTAVRAAGYTAAGGNRGVFDPANLGQAGRGPAPPLQKRAENSPEDACREMEKEVNALIEESSLLSLKREHGPALEKAKEAGKRCAATLEP